MYYRQKHIKPKLKGLKPKKIIFKRPVFWIVLGLVFLIAGGYFLFFWGKFQIEKVEVSGFNTIEKQEIEDIIWSSANIKLIDFGIFEVSSKSIFIVSANKIKSNILTKIPTIEELEVKRNFPDSLFVSVKEREPFAVFCKKDNICFLMDRSGVIFREAGQSVIGTILRKEPDVAETDLGEPAIDKSTMDIVHSVKKSLEDNFQIGLGEVTIGNTLAFKTSENWSIYFDPLSDMDLQVAKMNALLKDEIPPSARKNLKYIYLQYKDRAYYK